MITPIHPRKKSEKFPDIDFEDLFKRPNCSIWFPRWRYEEIDKPCSNCYNYEKKKLYKDAKIEDLTTFYCGKCHHNHYITNFYHHKYKILPSQDIRTKIKCDLCEKEYLNKSSLIRHKQKNH